MLTPLYAILRDPVLRMVLAACVLFGAYAATIAPYQSLVAIQVLGIADRGYAAILVAGSLVAVATSVIVGILTDQGVSRRRLALASAALMTLAPALVWLRPGGVSFALAHALLVPAAPIFGQIFALARIATLAHPAPARDAIMSTIRAFFAAPFVVVLPVWAWVLAHGAGLLTIYPAIAAMAALLGVLFAASWPRSLPQDRPSGQSFRAALREIAHPRVGLRVALLGCITAAVMTYMVLIGLVFSTTPGRSTSDVGLFVGFVAGLEVPFMLLVPMAQRLVPRLVLIAGGAVLYGIWLALMPILAPTPYVWGLILPAACAGALILTLPIAYLQDLLADRPGAGASLMALQKVAGDAACATAFTLGTALSGYGLAAMLGAGFAVAGGLGLWALDRRGARRMAG